MDALKRFSIPDEITLTTDGYHYRDALVEISRRVRTRVKRQRCLFQVMKNLSKKIHDACSDEALLDVKNLIRYVFFPTDENMEKLGKNKEVVASMTIRMDRKEATFRL